MRAKNAVEVVIEENKIRDYQSDSFRNVKLMVEADGGVPDRGIDASLWLYYYVDDEGVYREEALAVQVGDFDWDIEVVELPEYVCSELIDKFVISY